MRKPVRVLAFILGLMFVLFAGFQYNDPDPLLWIGLYALAAALSIGASLGKSSRALLLLAGLGYGIGVYFFWPAEWHGIALNELYKQNVEHARESLGLGLTSLCMFLLAFAVRS
ncbi:MAG: hypothetical protein HC913_14795 [Microscillaceae bacterium]|nr:hypothetical protein [Microscillaceae bacterium]